MTVATYGKSVFDAVAKRSIGDFLVCLMLPPHLSAILTVAPLSAGSLLLESLKDHISTTAQDHCKAIYLHVLTTNNTAINFYENRDFKQHHYLPYYYSIRGVLKDGFTYVLYINGGHPPWTILYPFFSGARDWLLSRACEPARAVVTFR